MGAPWPRTLYAYVLLRTEDQTDAWERELERLDGMQKMYTAIVAAFAGKDGAGLLDAERQAFTDRVLRARAPEVADTRLTQTFREHEAMTASFAQQASAGVWRILQVENRG